MDEAEIIAFIEQATLERGWISNSYAQVEYLLGDLILRCRQFPEYATQTATFTHSASKRVRKVRAILNIDGPLNPYIEQITNILDAFDTNHDIRNLLAHGFCEFHHTPAGDAGLYFRKFQRDNVPEGQNVDILTQRTFRLIDLQYHKGQMIHQSQQALEIFLGIYAVFGWGNLSNNPLEQN